MDASAAYTALLMALAGAVSAIAMFFKVEVTRRSKMATDLEAAFTKIRVLEERAGIRSVPAPATTQARETAS